MMKNLLAKSGISVVCVVFDLIIKHTEISKMNQGGIAQSIIRGIRRSCRHTKRDTPPWGMLQEFSNVGKQIAR